GDGKVIDRGFTGHEMLDELDLVHMNGRIYDPLVARFLSADPLIQDPEHSQSYNRYTYVWNNPTNMTDPTGFAGCVSSHTDGGREDGGSGCSLTGGLSPEGLKSVQGAAETIAAGGLVFVQDKDGTYTVIGGGANGPAIIATGAKLPSSLERSGTASADTSKGDKGNASRILAGGTANLVRDVLKNSIVGGAGGRRGGGNDLLGSAAALGAGSLLGDVITQGAASAEGTEVLRVYRGTARSSENSAWRYTGFMMSDAAREGFFENDFSLAAALAAGAKRHYELLFRFRSEELMAQAQTLTGTEFPFTPRSMFSVTTNLEVARSFAGFNGAVYYADIQRRFLVKTPVATSTEDEYFIRVAYPMKEVGVND
ncbi:RHS repeat-associated core domain-containing protein, partial [Chitinimonas viridis]